MARDAKSQQRLHVENLRPAFFYGHSGKLSAGSFASPASFGCFQFACLPRWLLDGH